MVILGIETSCDETAAAVVKDGVTILSNIVASSSDLHAKTGGIIPEEAARKQVEFIVPVIESSLSEAFSDNINNTQDLLDENIDAISVTYGPGLIGSLLVGVEAAKTLSLIYNKPLIPVNHIIAHSYANFLSKNQPKFPAINLIVSGGHTELLLMRSHNDFSFLGGTRDDAAGEAFDKIARILDLPYPGGPAISDSAEKYLRKRSNGKLNIFPRPMIDSNELDFSFSGLKTSVKNHIKNNKIKDPQKLAAEVQEAIVDSLVEKTIRACTEYRPSSLLLSGGVAANKRLREKLGYRSKVENPDIVFHVPQPKLCTDNATFIASRAFFSKQSLTWSELEADPQLSVRDL